MASSDESQQIQLHQLSELHHLEEFDCNYVFDYGEWAQIKLYYIVYRIYIKAVALLKIQICTIIYCVTLEMYLYRAISYLCILMSFLFIFTSNLNFKNTHHSGFFLLPFRWISDKIALQS